jgi:hypothetical protein
MFEIINLKPLDTGLFRNTLIKLVGAEIYGEILTAAKNKHYWDTMQEKATKLCREYGIEMTGFFRHDNEY